MQPNFRQRLILALHALHEQHLVTALRVCALVLAAFSTVAAGLILATEATSLDISLGGIKHFLELFSAPLTFAAGTIGLLTLETAIRALLESTRQSTSASIALLQSSYLEFTRCTSLVPMSVFDPTPFSDSYTDKWRDELFQVDYLAPVITLRRMFSLERRQSDSDPEPPLSEELISRSELVLSHFRALRSHLARGDPMWLKELVHLMVSTRQLRTYLAVRLPTMADWQLAPVLERSDELGPAIACPPYANASSIIDIVSSVKVELYCIACPLSFSRRATGLVQRMGDAANRLGFFGSHVPADLRKAMNEQSLRSFWTEAHRLHGRKIEI